MKSSPEIQTMLTCIINMSIILNICQNTVDSLTCRYGLVEDTSTYYLFQCQLFVTARTDLLDSSVPLLPTNIQCTTLLQSYGHSELTIETNNLFFLNVYIYQIHALTIDLIHLRSFMCVEPNIELLLVFYPSFHLAPM